MSKNKTVQKSSPTVEPRRKVHQLFAAYEAAHQHPVNKVISYIATPFLFFGLFALVWAIPFPHIAFLGQYNGFVNWASFVLAISVFCYYRLSPVLSYFILFTYFAFSFFIIKLEHWEQAGGPAFYIVPLIVTVVSITAIMLAEGLEQAKPSASVRLRNLLIGPLYLWHLILKPLRLNI
ncbi:DUF962 domain-containing protein [Mucilaginibacter roseus]|uniref:DUF962 domain-containing protein n=1 Tax=Mucilaginibacter roseus TaxID=1528868 RepID=A0ABS8U508_9SPHI|nr:Mpo1-like protein [Mucilaginibacter roseus]MCD8740573.1 DUF962 domain-containing protein [Mucilaginibacter roseus]